MATNTFEWKGLNTIDKSYPRINPSISERQRAVNLQPLDHLQVSRVSSLPLSLSLAELLLEEVVPLEPVEEDEERDEARATEATRRRASGLPFTRVPPLRAGGDLDGPRGRDTAASEPARQTSLLPGHAQHRWTQVFQLQDRSRTGPVVTQVGTVPSTFFFFPPSFLSFSLVFFLRLRYAHETEPAPSPLNERPSHGVGHRAHPIMIYVYIQSERFV